MNSLERKLIQGTFGELFVQLRLLQFDIQAAPPLKDTGNDLIAIRGDCFRAIQVKTVFRRDRIRVENPDRGYHIMALVLLDPNGSGIDLSLDNCNIFLIPRELMKSYFRLDELQPFLLSREIIERLF